MNPTLHESPEWVIAPSAPPPVIPPTPTGLERLVATHVGREARLGGDNPKHWGNSCLTQHACAPFKVLSQCDARLSPLDSLPNSPVDHQGQIVALRGSLTLAPVITTARACRPKPHDPAALCCNQIGTAAVVQCGNTPVLLDRLGCSGDESRLCCDTPAFGQPVVALGKLVRIPVGPGGIEWQLEGPKLCTDVP
jgi:hypothetical protein